MQGNENGTSATSKQIIQSELGFLIFFWNCQAVYLVILIKYRTDERRDGNLKLTDFAFLCFPYY